MHLPNAGTLIGFPAVKKFKKVQRAKYKNSAGAFVFVTNSSQVAAGFAMPSPPCARSASFVHDGLSHSVRAPADNLNLAGHLSDKRLELATKSYAVVAEYLKLN